MANKLTFALTLVAVLIIIDASPVKLIYEGLGTDSEEYDIEEEDLDDFGKLLDAADDKTQFNTSGYKKKNTENKGIKSKHNINDLKKFYQLVGAHNRGSDEDFNIYADVNAAAVGAVGENVKRTKKFKNGSKTRGFHRVHHKDEFKKDREFYEDDETAGDETKFGKGGFAFLGKAGNSHHKKHYHHNRQKGIHGRQGYLDNGALSKEFNGYSGAAGFEGSFSNK